MACITPSQNRAIIKKLIVDNILSVHNDIAEKGHEINKQ